ncbi:flavodoxin family protein [Tenacibaculum sp. M341]|uniref:flavodoxin family protein n=1 Tax=Tenacibaculum sp. M341 TaxID=2530339 RepID=UPI001044F406|nr:NAD(P)H-dependent oxidoreductase [Tenacibaculum sp. M341]TCI90322.1 NADPH-dependent oxidoreductase [Tenacibaculum sp. M341]
MKTKTVIIQASAKATGNTSKIVKYLNKNNDFDIIDISDKKIGHFNYDFKNANDDFLPLIEQIINKYDTIIFATPVYWYSMSGMLKVFFDRLSDLLHYKKELGRQMRGKKMAMISNSGENDLRTGFNMPFIESAKYLGMDYKGDIHAWFSKDGASIHEDAKKEIDVFRELFA